MTKFWYQVQISPCVLKTGCYFSENLAMQTAEQNTFEGE